MAKGVGAGVACLGPISSPSWFVLKTDVVINASVLVDMVNSKGVASWVSSAVSVSVVPSVEPVGTRPKMFAPSSTWNRSGSPSEGVLSPDESEEAFAFLSTPPLLSGIGARF